MASRAAPFHRFAAAVLGFVTLAAVASLLAPAQAQAQDWFGPQPQRRYAPQPRQQPSFNPFGFFAPSPNPYYDRPNYRNPDNAPRYRSPEQRTPTESVRAPAPRKPDGTPTTQVVVFGDALADWLAYGIEEAYEDDSTIGVTRKNRLNSGLIRNDTREGYDWVQSARDILAAEKADFVVIMLGLSDRQSIRERPAPKPANNTGSQQPPSIAAEPPSGPSTNEFRSEKWAELYGKRIDEMIAVLKSKGVPVLWVGLPVIRGARGKADALYLNDLYRSHAEKAGITYVDVWDGFVDDNGDFALYGPDYDGQTRRLRSHDGVHFTKAGALKLGHYVERELQRLIQARTAPVAVAPTPEPTRPNGPAPRPDAGPVVPLTAVTGETDGLAGGGPARNPTPDPTVARVLVKGETLAATPGRADDFAWPRPDAVADSNDVIPIVQAAPAPVRPAPPVAAKKTPAPKRPGQAAADPPPPQKQVR
jgi:hypothetical protein